MRVKHLLGVGALGIFLTLGWEARAEIYYWTDDHGTVHMTDQWSNVPEAMRSRLAVRGSPTASSTIHQESAVVESIPSLPESHPVNPLPWQMPPDLEELPAMSRPDPSALLPSGDASGLALGSRVHAPRTKRPSPPFPYNVRLDPSDRHFVWVGPNRVPKDLFTYPRVSLERQAQFRDRLRTLERRKSEPRNMPTLRPGRPVS
jgi:hypothetical protein